MPLEEKLKKCSKIAQQPILGTSGSAGSNLYSCEEKVIEGFSCATFRVNLQIAIPEG